MPRERRPRVLVVDLEAQGALAGAVEECLASWCCLIRAETLSAPGEPAAGSSGAGDAGCCSGDSGVAGVIVCVSTIDAASERKIACTLSRWRRLPILLVAHDADRVVLQRLRDGFEMATVLLRTADTLTRIERLWSRSQADGDSLEAGAERPPALAGLIGESAPFRDLIDQLRRAASSDCTVLIEGESGTGKEVCARAIHALSAHADGPFLALNCGALPENLIESELFGHKKGAFTDATESRAGLVYAAHGGTLFLDEVGALPLAAQVKLLRVVQEREVRPVGSTETLRVDTRIVGATNVDLWRAVQSGTFREDLYYRLNVFRVKVPRLRERGEDVLLLARHFLRRFAGQSGRAAPSVSAGAEGKLRTYHWPGNVRELESAMERVVVACWSRTLTESDFILGPPESPYEGSLAEVRAEAIAEAERSYLHELVVAHDGNLNEMARSARASRQTLWRLLRKYGIKLEDYRPKTR